MAIIRSHLNSVAVAHCSARGNAVTDNLAALADRLSIKQSAPAEKCYYHYYYQADAIQIPSRDAVFKAASLLPAAPRILLINY